MDQIIFRLINESDLAELREWHVDEELAARYGGRDWPNKLWEIMQNDQSRKCFLAMHHDDVIGYVDIELHFEEDLFWIGLAVKPALRKQGFGKEILRTFIDSPHTKGFKEIWAGIEKDNIASRRCFENAGFTPKNPDGDEEGIIDYFRII